MSREIDDRELLIRIDENVKTIYNKIDILFSKVEELFNRTDSLEAAQDKTEGKLEIIRWVIGVLALVFVGVTVYIVSKLI